MPSDPKPSRSKGKSSKPKLSALDAEQQMLREQEEALQAKIAALQETIKEAPKKAAEARRRQVEAVQAATPRRGAYLHSATMLDTRHVEAAAASGRMRPRTNGRRKPVVLRNERAAGRKQTLALVIVLALAICWALSHFLT